MGAPPAPPPQQFQFQAFGAGGGTNEQGMVAMPPDAAFDNTLSQLSAFGAQVSWQQRPSGVRFKYAKFTWYAGFKVKYEGTVNITPYGPVQSQVSATIKVLHGELVIEWMCVAVALVLLIVYNYATMGIFSVVLAAILGLGWVFVVSSKLPRDLARQIIEKVSMAAPVGTMAPTPPTAAPVMPAAQFTPAAPPPAAQVVPAAPPTPTPPPAAPPRAPAPPPPATGQSDGVALLKQLVELRDQNLITQEEFDAKKREILNRMMQ